MAATIQTRWLVAAMLAVSTLPVMSGTTIAPALPALNAHFHDVAHAELLTKLVLTMPAFFIAALAPLMGAVADRFGRKPLLLASALLYALAGASGYVLDSLPAILVGRALLGVAVAGLMTSSMALMGDYFDGVARRRYMGLQASFVGLGGVAFLTFGGLLAGVGWRMPFLIYLAALLMWPLLAFALYEPERRAHAAPGEAGGRGHLGAVALIYGAMFVTMAVFYMVPVQLPFHLQATMGASPAQIGMAIAASTLVSALISPYFPRVRARLSDVGLLATSLALMGAGLTIVATAPGYAQVVAGLMVMGAGSGLNMPNMSSWLMTVAPAHMRGRLAGGLTTSLFLGQFLSPLFSEPLGRSIGLGATFGVAGAFVGVLAIALAGGRLLAGRRTIRPEAAS